MNIPLDVRAKVFGDVERAIGLLEGRGHRVRLLCHDHRDLEFAASFRGIDYVYAPDVFHYLALLRACDLNISYRLHAAIPCLAFGIPFVKVTYDERAKSLMETVGLGGWDIDMLERDDVASEIDSRLDSLAELARLRDVARSTHWESLGDAMSSAFSRFASAVSAYEEGWRPLSEANMVHIIAEAGTNHGGDPAVGLQLIEAASTSGADSVKFQLIYPEGLYLPRVWSADGLIHNDVFDQRASSMLDDDDFRQLAQLARERGIEFSCSVFDRKGIELLVELEAPYIKIASCDLNNSELLLAAAQTGRRLVLSTGMAELEEIDRAVRDIRTTGNDDIILMHCVSRYPTPTEDMNLGFLSTLKDRFGFPVGLSDHTESNVAAVMAVSLGIVMLEKHLTLDRGARGFDHAYATRTGFLQTPRRGCQSSRGRHQATERQSGC